MAPGAPESAVCAPPRMPVRTHVPGPSGRRSGARGDNRACVTTRTGEYSGAILPCQRPDSAWASPLIRPRTQPLPPPPRGRPARQHSGGPGARRQRQDGGSGGGAEHGGGPGVRIDGAARVVGALPPLVRPGPKRPVDPTGDPGGDGSGEGPADHCSHESKATNPAPDRSTGATGQRDQALPGRRAAATRPPEPRPAAPRRAPGPSRSPPAPQASGTVPVPAPRPPGP